MHYQVDEGMPANRFVVHQDDGRIEPVHEYPNLIATIEPGDREIVWLVTVGYTTGDSLGRDPEVRHEYVDIYPTRDAAEVVAKAIRAHERRAKTTSEDERNMPITFGNGETRKIYLPWTGFFQSLEFIEVQEVTVGPPLRQRF